MPAGFLLIVCPPVQKTLCAHMHRFLSVWQPVCLFRLGMVQIAIFLIALHVHVVYAIADGLCYVRFLSVLPTLLDFP